MGRGFLSRGTGYGGPIVRQGCEGEMALCWSKEWEPWDGSHLFISEGCLLSVGLYRRGVQDLLKISPSSLFMLCGCISSSVALLMS